MEYRCPDCTTTCNMHAPDCDWNDESIHAIEKANIDVISTLLNENAVRDASGANPGIAFRVLARKVSNQLEDEAWRSIHTAVLHDLKARRIVVEDDELGGIYLQEPEAREAEVIPQYDPMKTVYEHGPIDGCKDYAVFAMVSWCEMVGLDWEQTHEFVSEWLLETGAWDRESWGEATIDELLAGKRHVHERGLGWRERAEHAMHVIEESSAERQLDASCELERFDR